MKVVLKVRWNEIFPCTCTKPLNDNHLFCTVTQQTMLSAIGSNYSFFSNIVCTLYECPSVVSAYQTSPKQGHPTELSYGNSAVPDSDGDTLCKPNFNNISEYTADEHIYFQFCCAIFSDRTVRPLLFRDRISNCTDLFRLEPNWTRHRIFTFVRLLLAVTANNHTFQLPLFQDFDNANCLLNVNFCTTE